jgi:hypothetical protein
MDVFNTFCDIDDKELDVAQTAANAAVNIVLITFACLLGCAHIGCFYHFCLIN